MSDATAAQIQAITARGNVLVVAGAGAGKTRTLVERCVTGIRDRAESIEDILMVTFTEAAAAEMRRRIREGLTHALDGATDAKISAHLHEQVALVETAQISTLHSFCLRLVQENFFELGLDPQISVLPTEQARLLAQESFAAVLERHIEGDSAVAKSIQELVEEHGRGWDKPIRELVLRLHAYAQTRVDPAGWLKQWRGHFAGPTPATWREWLRAACAQWRADWLETLATLDRNNSIATEAGRLLQSVPKDPAPALQAIQELESTCPRGKKKLWLGPLESFFAEVEFLLSLCQGGEADPLQQDWDWTRGPMTALLTLADEFEVEFTRAKREQGAIDFHDLEQLALRLLWNPGTRQPTDFAREWRERHQFVFVDEYQDINEAQDAILQALGGEGERGNRFLVGDVKQSIYRFRLASPRIFLDYEKSWAGPAGHSVIYLSENFRSHEAILDFVNALFAPLLLEKVGGVGYGEAARLRFGNRSGRGHLARRGPEDTRVELHLLIQGGAENPEEPEEEHATDADREARWAGRRLLELKAGSIGEGAENARPVEWRDMVILLRSPKKRAEAYAREFSRLGIPLQAGRGGFFSGTEVSDLLNLLRLLDNPLQDLPLLAVLRSPLVRLSLEELGEIRLAHRDGSLWTALARWRELNNPPPTSRVSQFLARFQRWRESLRHLSLSQCAEGIVDETQYRAGLEGAAQSQTRVANVERLLQLTRQFDSFRREGLFRFLKFIDAQQAAEIEIEPASAEAANAVRLMSIHQSKGLEFPIVVVAALGKLFNRDDLNGRVILDEEFGPAPQVKPPQRGQSYPSLPYWLAQRRQQREMLGEELRLLYVATTRACQRLVLVGTASQKRIDRWSEGAEFGAREIAAAKSVLDWIGPWLGRMAGGAGLEGSGANQWCTWQIHADGIQPAAGLVSLGEPALPPEPTPGEVESLRKVIQWTYPQAAVVELPAKTSISALRRRQAAELEEEAAPARFTRPRGRGGAEVGLAHHRFLELVPLDAVADEGSLKAAGERLVQSSLLNATELASINFPAVAGFWNSAVGTELLQHQEHLHREMEFIARFELAELAACGLSTGAESPGDFVLIQGVVDLAVILPGEIWLLDFKTDRTDDIAGKSEFYRSQLALYAHALQRIHARPVTRQWLHFFHAGTTVAL